MQSLIKIHKTKEAALKEKDSFKLARRDAKQELRTVSNRRQKAAPGQVLAE